MGMISTFLEQDIKVKKPIPEDLLKGTVGEELIKEQKIDFGVWDDTKLEGYWYDETIEILNLLAPFLEGYVEFLYEEGWNFRIVFENGKVYVQIARLFWGSPKTELKKRIG